MNVYLYEDWHSTKLSVIYLVRDCVGHPHRYNLQFSTSFKWWNIVESVWNTHSFIHPSIQLIGGGRVVRWCWLTFKCQVVLLIWIIIGHWPAALAVGAVGIVWTCFFHLSFLSSFPLSLWDSPIRTGILSQRVVRPKTTNQPTNQKLKVIQVPRKPVSKNLFTIFYYSFIFHQLPFNKPCPFFQHFYYFTLAAVFTL